MPVMPPMPGTGPIAVLVNGSPVHFDVPPRLSGGWVFVPLRGVFEKLGAKVAFQKASGLVTADRGATHVEIRVGDRLAHVNGGSVLMLQPAFAVRGRTMVPLRFLSEALGAHVDWNGGRQVVNIHTHPSE